MDTGRFAPSVDPDGTAGADEVTGAEGAGATAGFVGDPADEAGQRIAAEAGDVEAMSV
ncbi:hypothetical protein HW445_15515, partial [Streptomyces sp. UH6]|nr:hypothetical protein [Streptomyces sp. UH6]